ncbi:RNA recognition motif protein [Toxoplasma gondii VAND]|uniref:RNA recognition motif protein n=1 Tax=Toxoplasma gondii VAND TaxID=933077 RepID=A0A086QJC9_TOXGO|nr:RNA recognition motif protein [Toxoplasma gondii VAND]
MLLNVTVQAVNKGRRKRWVSAARLQVRLVLDFRRRSKGFAYADFESSEEASAAAARMHGVKIRERPMKVLMSQPTRSVYEEKTLFISQVSERLDEAEVAEELARLGFVNICGVRLIGDSGAEAQSAEKERTAEEAPHRATHKGYGFVDFSSQDATVKALQFFLRRQREAQAAAESQANFLLGGKPFVLAPSIPMKKHRWILAPPNKEAIKWEREARKEAPVDATTIFVKNLAFSVSEEELANHFVSLFSVIPSQTVVCRDASGKSRGFAFVKFDTEADAMAAMLANDSPLSGRPLTVSRSTRNITTPKQQHTRPQRLVGAKPAERQRPGVGFDARKRHQKPRLALGETGPKGEEERAELSLSSSSSASSASSSCDVPGAGGEVREKENEEKEEEMQEEREAAREERAPGQDRETAKEEKKLEKGETNEKKEGEKKTNAYFRQLFLSGGL